MAAITAVACGGSAEDASVPSGSDSSNVAESSGVTLVEVGVGPCCLNVGDDGIWVMNHRDRSLQHVDPQTNQPDQPVSVHPYDEMVGAGDKLLLTVPEGYQAALFDPQTGKVGRATPIEGAVRGAAFDATSNTLWVGSASNGTLTHIDVDSGRVLDRFAVEGLPSGGSMVCTGNNELWVATFDNEILQVDLARHRVVTRLKPFGKAEVNIAFAGGYLWATSFKEPTLLRIDPGTGEIDRRGNIDAAGSQFPRLFTAPDGTLWAVAAPDRIDRLDPETGQTRKSYDIPLSDDANPDDYYSVGGVVTGFGAVWTTVFNNISFVDDAVVRLEK
jgi:streptogramin lyase